MGSKIWLSAPDLGDSEMVFIQEAFAQNWIAPIGPNVIGFERDLESYLGKEIYVAALNSGTAAIHLALIGLGVTFGDEVICQTMTFAASANPIVYLGAHPVFVDSECQTWNMCPKALEEAILHRMQQVGKKPKAIILVHSYGMPAQLDAILGVADTYDIPVIEDAAESLGSRYKGQLCGTFGKMAALSFNGNKIITTSSGGALVCKSLEEQEQVVFLATQARDEAPHYEHSQIGYNYRMSNICAGIGRGQMRVLEGRILSRRANNKFYQELFKNIKGVTVFVEPSLAYYSNHWLTCITIDERITGKSNRALRLALLASNIETRLLWKPMHLQPVFVNAPYYGSARIAEQLFNQGLSLPSGSSLSDNDKERIAEAIRVFFE